MIISYISYLINILDEIRIDNMKHFHVHIYFNPADSQLAYAVFKNANLMNLFEFVKFHEQPIGPHPTGMIEMHFNETSYNQVVDWVEVHREIFSVLIHQDTGDDFKDHRESIRWLGTPVVLDFSFFELVQARPHLRIHQI